MQPEMYRTIKDFPLYEVSNYGNVRSWNTRGRKSDYPHVMKTQLGRKGVTRYKQLVLSKNNIKYSKKPHVLVLLAFVGPKPDGMEGCHTDGDSMNNRLENLRWDTHTNNMRLF